MPGKGPELLDVLRGPAVGQRRQRLARQLAVGAALPIAAHIAILEGDSDAALGSALGLWPIFLGAIAIAAATWWVDLRIEARSRQIPNLSDVLLALSSATVVLYWVIEFENLNYRAGAENELDALVSIIGILLSLEVCRRVLGWSMTFIGIGAQRAGTTWLYECLNQHPQVFMSAEKELGYFGAEQDDKGGLQYPPAIGFGGGKHVVTTFGHPVDSIDP